MPVDPNLLSSLASDYAKDISSIRGRRVQRLVKREFAGAERVMIVNGGDSAPGVLGVSSSGAAFCATNGRGPSASLIKWLHGAGDALEVRFDLLKDSLPVLSSRSVPVVASMAREALSRK